MTKKKPEARVEAAPGRGRYTAAQVEIAAAKAHEANRAYCASIGDMSQLPWSEAPDWQRRSAISGVEFAIANNFPSPEAMHDNWMQEKIADGWIYGPVKDEEKEQHPCLVGYPSLPEAQKRKNAIFRETVMAALGHMWGDAMAAAADAPSTDNAPPFVDPEMEARLLKAAKEALAIFWPAPGSDPPTMDPAAAPGEPPIAAQVRQDNVMSLTRLMMADVSKIPGRFLETLAQFFSEHRDAPPEAALMQLKLTHGAEVPADMDLRHGPLLIGTLRHAFLGWLAIYEEDEKTKRAAQAAATLQEAKRPADPDDLSFQQDRGRGERSDLGRSLDRQG